MTKKMRIELTPNFLRNLEEAPPEVQKAIRATLADMRQAAEMSEDHDEFIEFCKRLGLKPVRIDDDED